MSRIAVVLFNLGGPDRVQSIRPFLFNLFNDPAIIGAPTPIRWLLAQFISRRRAPVAADIYNRIGGKSPLLELTQRQAQELENRLREKVEARVFVAMRYWHPMSDETVQAVKAFGPDKVVLLPLYPQYSTTTTASSAAGWHRAARRAGMAAPTTLVCCYPTAPGLIAAFADLTRQGIEKAKAHGAPRVLFSAHGLPQKIVDQGDPYPGQVEATAAAVRTALGLARDQGVVCYQSRVGPLKWIGPSTEDELRRAGRDRAPVVVVPIAFVSEHSETLVELDMEYREKAHAWGVPGYERVPALATHPAFIGALAELVERAMIEDDPVIAAPTEGGCRPNHIGCGRRGAC